ncbi:Oidioi.mRNA.OKI2018_I69.XSR.g16060.t1.cds [Oikopleura dioica]|uniref:Oidioi.mRNA.OKI2018_I69.XSR.g16060.t1.cds n=1 Tax=Oikopleura dioica TaxID=34765 RepID=A0ABN7SJY6_OIKDI|nr:Oidioi.mRNA.OKI2018_I69.XSR.g16060.t1.cds [Oikopleura dioica]
MSQSSQSAVCDQLMTKLDYEEDRAAMTFVRRRRIVDETKARVRELKNLFNKNHQELAPLLSQFQESVKRGEPAYCREHLQQAIEKHQRRKDKLVCEIQELERMLIDRANLDFARPQY